MKLLFDENLSPRLVRLLAETFPGSSHVDLEGQRGAADQALWALAAAAGYTIVSKDNDFRQRAFLHGAPPKVVWLSIGNAGTEAIALILRENRDVIARFLADPEQSLLVLRLT